MPRVNARYAALRRAHERHTLDALTAEFTRQREELDPSEWDHSLTEVLFAEIDATARAFGRRVADALQPRRRFIPAQMTAWLFTVARNSAENINNATRQLLDAAGDDTDQVTAVFDELVTARAALYSVSLTGTAANFAVHDAAASSGATSKTWQTNSGNPRSAHAALHGVTVAMRDTFPGGMRWPGDPAGGAEQVANCMCSLIVEG